jgi:predicted ATPase
VINLDSPTDYRKIPRPSKNVYFSPLDAKAEAAANEWFEYFGGLPLSKVKPAELELWGRKSIYESRSWLTIDLPFRLH